jgi:hypothetical protein
VHLRQDDEWMDGYSMDGWLFNVWMDGCIAMTRISMQCAACWLAWLQVAQIRMMMMMMTMVVKERRNVQGTGA